MESKILLKHLASKVSKEIEIKLIGVARASMEESLLDYKDYLRQHGLMLWSKNDPKTHEIRRLGRLPDRSYTTYKTYILRAALLRLL